MNLLAQLTNDMMGSVYNDIGIKNYLPMNSYETDSTLELEFAIPGYLKENIKLEVSNRKLKINAKKDEAIKRSFLSKEFWTESFNKSIILPSYVSDEINARYENGILYVSVVKSHQKQSKTINIV